MKVYIVIQTFETYNGFHGTTETFIIGVYSTKHLALLECSPTQIEQNSGDECTTSWHVEKWDVEGISLQLPHEDQDDTCEQCHSLMQKHCFHCDSHPM